MKTMSGNILKGRKIKWIAIKINNSDFPESENNAILKRVVDGFFPIKDKEGNNFKHYIILNRKMNGFGLFETVKSEIAKEIDVPFFWKLMFCLGKDIYMSNFD